MDRGPVFRIGHDHINTVAAHAVGVEAMFHRVAGGEKQRLAASIRLQGCGGFVDDVDEGDARHLLDRFCDEVHGVGADEHTIGTGIGKACAGGAQKCTGLIPAIGLLKGDDFGKIKRMHDDIGRDQPTAAVAHGFIDHAVIGCGGFPAHAADQTDAFHKSSLIKFD